MKKIILVPAIVLLVCCVTVGAFNVVAGSDNRPMTLYESLVTLSNIEFSFDEISNLLYKISDMWSPSSSTHAGPGGNGTVSGGGTLVDGQTAKFGSPNYRANTGHEWLDNVLDFLSDFISTFYIVIQIVVLLIKDTVTTVYTLFDVITKFITGVPKTTA